MRLWLGIGVFAAVVVIAFALFVLHITSSPHTTEVPSQVLYASITDVRIKDSYSSKTGVHSISGSGTVPSACTVLSATSTVSVPEDASSTPTIRIDLTAPIDTGTCLELPTPEAFSLSVKAASNSSIEVFANGERVSMPEE